MFDDDIVITTKRTVAATSNSGHYGGSNGKSGRDDQNRRGKCDSTDSRSTSHHNEAKKLGDRAAVNPLQDNNTEHTRFTLPPSKPCLAPLGLQTR